MKQIVKVDEPSDFAEWKANDKMAHRPNWKRVPGPIRKSLHESLLREQGFICCYCESSISEVDSHIEHFRPRRFKERLLDYENLHSSCQRSGEKRQPCHCGHLKGKWFDEELLISPLEESCENRFIYTGNGGIFPRTDGDAAAETTIRKLGLDLPKLRELRAAAIDAFGDLAVEDIERMLVRRADGAYPAFYSAIAQVLAS